VTVFIDDMRAWHRVGNLRARWSHLMAGPFDPIAELHELAAEIGLQRRWFQGPPKHPWPRSHYDVTDSMREAAIAAGAIPITFREAGVQMLRARKARREAEGAIVADLGPGAAQVSNWDLWQTAKTLYELKMSDE
jgi:Protein of unknown function (DUF4031)